MRPPSLAQALVAAAAPASDYEIVAGDLHEEYLHLIYTRGEAAADRWYWTQALLSIPSLLSYSRSKASGARLIGIAFTALAILIAMLAVIMVLDTVLGNVNRIPSWAWVCVYCTDAAISGAILAWLIRADGVRVTFFSSVFLVLCFVVPAIAGHPGSQAPLAAWLRLFAAIPVMCTGAGISQAIRRRVDSEN